MNPGPDSSVEDKNGGDFYRRIARLYDVLLEPLVHHIRDALREWMFIHDIHSVLDVCCGTGKQLSYFPDTVDAHGIDLSDAMLTIARRQVPGRCIRGDATSLPLRDAAYDLAVSQFALHEKTPDVIAGELREVRRILKPGGYFAVVDFAVPDMTNQRLLTVILRWGIRQIERHAGDEHYENYQQWMAAGGLKTVLPANGWHPVHEQKFYKGNIVLIVFRFNGQ